MSAGKNKLMRWARVYVGGYDLSGDTRTFDRLDNQMEEVPFTGLSDTVGNYLADLVRMVGVRGYQAYVNDAAAGAATILATPPKQLPISVFLGGGDVPAVSDMAYLLPGISLADAAEFSSKAGLFSLDFLLDAASFDTGFDNPNGMVLMPLTALAASTNGSSVDFVAGGTKGAHANLHITVSSGGTWAFAIQHSTTGAFAGEETTMLSFTINGSSVTAQWKSATGTVNRYKRLRAVRTSGTCTIACACAQN